MATSLSTPGVYIRIQEPAPVLPLSLSITGFVGQATSGPINYPQALANWGQFQDIFGSFTGFSFLSYAVYGFFQNGGIRCHVVRVADESAGPATANLDYYSVNAGGSGYQAGDVLTLQQLTCALNADGAGYKAGDVLTLVQTGGSGGTITVNSVSATGAVETFSVTTIGTGYTTADGITVTGGTGTGATFNITSGRGGTITVNSVSTGTGYQAGDVLTLVQTGGSGATITVNSVSATGGVLTLSVTTNGTGYTTANGVTVTGGSGTGATFNITGGSGGTITVNSSGLVLTFTVTTIGTGYTAANGVTVSGGNGSGATFDIDPVICASAANPGSWGNDVTVTVGPSSGIFTQAQLTQPAQDKTDDTITVSTVAGIQAGDSLTLIDPSNPLTRATFTVKQVDNAGLQITFQTPLGQTYLAGTKVVGPGFKLTAQYAPGGGVLARQEVFDNLSMDPNNPQYFLRIVNGIPEDPDYVNKGLNGRSILIHLVDFVAVQAQQQGKPALGQPRPASGTVTLQNGLDWPSNQPAGLVTPHYTGYTSGAYFSTTQFNKWGLAVLEDVPEIGLIAIPDLCLPDLYSAVSAAAIQVSPDGIVFTPVPPDGVLSTSLKQGQSDMLAHCAFLQDRFAILDSPRGAQIGIGASPIDDWVSNFRLATSSKNAALYYPWIREQASDFNGYDLLIPPCGHLAGIYAAVESQRGIGKAPANQIVQGIIDLEFCVSDTQQAVLNPLSVNCLRALPGRGLMVWGARTLSLDPNWRYLNLRRIYHAIVMNILLNLRWSIFEPNTPKLWAQVKATLTLFLTGLFRQGALAGNTVADAFFVECDDQTNTPDIIAAGQMLTRIGFAPAYPAEFVVVNILRTAEALAVSEQT